MTERRFRRLPVVEDGKLLGLVSIGDLVKVRLSETACEAHVDISRQAYLQTHRLRLSAA